MTRILIPRSDNTSAKTIEASDWEKYFSSDIVADYLITGLCVTAQCPNVLAVDIAIGEARVGGLYLENTTSCSVTCLTACSSNKIYAQLCRDPSCEPQGFIFGTTTGCLPADSFQLATAVTNATTVTSVSQLQGTDTNTYPVTNKIIGELNLTICCYTTPCTAVGSSTSECGSRVVTAEWQPCSTGCGCMNSYFSQAIGAVNGACTNSVLNGKTYSQLKVNMRRVSCASGTITGRTWNSGGITSTWNNYPAACLCTSFTERVFTAPTSCDYWQPVDCTRAYIGVSYCKASDIKIQTGVNDCFDGTNTRRYRNTTGTPTCAQATDMVFQLLHWDAIAVVDDNVCDFWQSNSECNPNIYVDMGSTQRLSMMAIHANSATTVCELKIQVSCDACAWTDVRTIDYNDIVNCTWNYIRFNIIDARYVRVYGNDGSAKVLAIDEIKLLTVTDTDLTLDHRHVFLDPQDSTLPL